MKALALIFCFVAGLTGLAQTNPAPIRLAIVPETAEASGAADVLTAEFNKNDQVQLLERAEIEKVYREQGLSAANGDTVKLGRILGADGLLLLKVVRTPHATNFTARLIAVKPGIILTDGSFPWPLTNAIGWAESSVKRIGSFAPKLALAAKDAIPISVVNLRSALPSAEGQETEEQLKLLTIQRLSQERQLFVLERQKMRHLSDEKELESDESAFWTGSYLLDGIVDQDGGSKDIVTIDARMMPPHGGPTLQFHVDGSRTNLAEVVNRLAVNVIGRLNIDATTNGWNAADEAQQYLDEAKWALKWGVYAEAQAAVDSAWALGKDNLDCAQIRVSAYLVPPDLSGITHGTFFIYNNLAQRVDWSRQTNDLLSTHAAVSFEEDGDSLNYIAAANFPDPESIDHSIQALELYYEFSRSSPDGVPQVLTRGPGWNDWHDSDWYKLGLEVLVNASQILQQYNLSPKFYQPEAGKLAELRARARSVAELISQSPTVHDSYFVGDRVVVYDELANTVGEDGGRNPNIFSCKVKWGCFWQEKPEDDIALYRELMSSPVFCYIHSKFWFPQRYEPRRWGKQKLIAWNEADQERTPAVWNGFVQKLNTSSNTLLRLEAKAVQLADASTEDEMVASFTNLFNAIWENEDTLINNNVDALYLGWQTGDLIEQMRGGTSVDARDSLQRLYYSTYKPKLEAMENEYRAKTVMGQKDAATFAKQTEYLSENKPYDFQEFVQLFVVDTRAYSKAQALEIRPLVATYKSNILAQSQSASGIQKAQTMGTVAQIEFLEQNIDRILNPPLPQTSPQPRLEAPSPAVQIKPAAAVQIVAEAPAAVTNAIQVSKFLAIPWERLIQLDRPGQFNNEYLHVAITAHHWQEDKLLLNFKYDLWDNVTGRHETGPALAILEPTTEHWDVLACPAAADFYHSTTLLNGDLYYCGGGVIEKYDFATHQWRTLKISDGSSDELFAVHGKLYAANGSAILEIADDGQTARLLASTRRNPPASKLDQEDLGTPTLFEGPGGALRACTGSKIFTWTGDDWREDCAAHPASSPPEIFANGLLFRQNGFLEASYQNDVIYRRPGGTYGTLVRQDDFFQLAKKTNVATCCLQGWINPRYPGSPSHDHPKASWETPPNLLPELPAALSQSDLCIFEDSFAARALVDGQGVIREAEAGTNMGYNAALLYFSHDCSVPQKLFLSFAGGGENAPACSWIYPAANLLFFGAKDKGGIWLLPLSEVESASEKEKTIQLQEQSKKLAAVDEARKSLLAKYDLNHNGVIGPEEKEAALDDPAFIESELDNIDANHNGWLDAQELSYFDANHNKILDPKEQAGIEIAQRLLAARLLKQFDTDGNGILDAVEFSNLQQTCFAPSGGTRPETGFFFNVSSNPLENLLTSQTSRGLRVNGEVNRLLMERLMTPPSTRADPATLFKAMVEAYWQNSAAGHN